MTMEANHLIISTGFRYLLAGIGPYIARELKAEHGEDWWQKGVWDVLYEDQRRGLSQIGEEKDLIGSLDVQRCLQLLDANWQQVFRKKLSIDHRTWAKELTGFRNKLAHIGSDDFSDNDTWRALDTMSRLCEQIDPENTEDIRALLRDLCYGPDNGARARAGTTKSAGVLNVAIEGLPSWRSVIEPHPDVAQGRYKKAEFAADLAQVANGEGSIEYRDPVEFFRRTYVTEGMKGLLVQALKRVSGGDGEPVIQLKTAFGGGKTHSMLALYHMMRGRVPLEKIPAVKPALEEAGVSSLPRANVAVLVGTSLDPTKTRRPQNFPGITINTLWGEMAAQLAANAGDPKLYDLVKEADKKGVSPGSRALKELFDACGPCLVLMDEIVAYAKKLHGVSGLPAGSFDNFITFIQELTEAARASRDSLVVASIPESAIEIGEGPGGKKALEAIEHTFGRMESIWRPVAAGEGFEVVRRRLFLDCKDPDARDRVANSFSKMYAAHQSDFPIEAREAAYRDRIVSCYPIHPEMFDRLYEDWATLDQFQRTRGVLRLMAAVIYELWMGNDSSALIMPGSIPLDVPDVRDELIKHLGGRESWNAIIDREIDGKRSIPYKKDTELARFGKILAARRVARAIMLGSAPTSRAQAVRGIERSHIRLGVVQPGETIADFNDALGTLQYELAYLYTDSVGNRSWYDTRPTLRKTVEDRAKQIADADVAHEIKERLGKIRKEKPFAGIHICPASSLDVPDEQAVRLVILRPEDEHAASRKEDSAAIRSWEDLLDDRGSSPRMYRNMLAFVAPDEEQMKGLKEETRRYLAWRSVEKDSEDLGLDRSQEKETKDSVARCDKTVDSRVQETWCWLLVPYTDREADVRAVVWDVAQIGGGTESIVSKAARTMLQNEWLIERWAPAPLLMALDDVLWKDGPDIAIKTLWDHLCTYCYLPRLASYDVLERAILSGLGSEKRFALADAKSEDGRYIGLRYDHQPSVIDKSAWLVKLDVAMRQIEEEEQEREKAKRPMPVGPVAQPVQDPSDRPGTGTTPSGSGHPVSPHAPTTVQTPKSTHFFLSAPLDDTRIIRDVQKLFEEVISHLKSVDNGDVKISLEVDMTAPDGVPQSVVRTVSENCQTLKVKDFGFEER